MFRNAMCKLLVAENLPYHKLIADQNYLLIAGIYLT